MATYFFLFKIHFGDLPMCLFMEVPHVRKLSLFKQCIPMSRTEVSHILFPKKEIVR